MPYSPLGRGLLTGKVAPGSLSANDARLQRFPRFAAHNLEVNLARVQRLEQVAAARQATPGQVALAWLLHQGEDLVPIPGTKRRAYLEENAAATELRLTPDELAALDAIGPAQGQRYADLRSIDT